jgi:hypothetical protein
MILLPIYSCFVQVNFNALIKKLVIFVFYY